MAEAIRFNASLNTAGFDSGAARLQQAAAQASSKVSASFASMGASIARVIAPFVGLYAAVNSVKNALDMGGKLNDLSKTTGETAGNLAVLQRAFDNTGVGAEKVGISVQKMSEFIVGLQQGSASATKAADTLGITLADLAGKSPIAQMQTIMAALAGIRDPALRSAMAVDVFGKAGRDIVPLAKEFGGAMAEARSELGSLPRILDENAASLDQLGDKLTNAVGSKLTELAVGLTAGVTGAKDLASALATIDAAGFGETLGNSLRAAFAAPTEYAKAIGEFLLAGVLKAANALDAAMKNAVNVYYEMMQNPGFWDGFFMYIEAGFAKVGEAFTSIVIDAMKAALSAMDWNPLWKPFTDLAKGALDEISTGITDAGIAATSQMEQGATQMKAAWNNATAASQYVYEDTFGAEQHLAKAAEHMDRAKQAAEAMKTSSEFVAENLNTASTGLAKALDAMRGFDAEGNLAGFADSPYPDNTRGGGANMMVADQQQEDAKKSGRGSTASAPRSNAPATFNERVGELRGQARQRPFDQRASELAARGMYGSAIRNLMRGEKAFDDAMNSARAKDLAAMEDFAGRAAKNAGEAFQGFRERVGGLNAKDELRRLMNDVPDRDTAYNDSKSIEQNYKDYLKGLAKTPKELQAQEDQQRAAGGGGATQPTDSTTGKLDKIINIMEERLPIRVLAA